MSAQIITKGYYDFANISLLDDDFDLCSEDVVNFVFLRAKLPNTDGYTMEFKKESS